MTTTVTPLRDRIAVGIPDACQMSGLGRSHMYELLASGAIRSVKSGSRRLVLVDSLVGYLTEETVTP